MNQPQQSKKKCSADHYGNGISLYFILKKHLLGSLVKSKFLLYFKSVVVIKWQGKQIRTYEEIPM